MKKLKSFCTFHLQPLVNILRKNAEKQLLKVFLKWLYSKHQESWSHSLQMALWAYGHGHDEATMSSHPMFALTHKQSSPSQRRCHQVEICHVWNGFHSFRGGGSGIVMPGQHLGVQRSRSLRLPPQQEPQPCSTGVPGIATLSASGHAQRSAAH